MKEAHQQYSSIPVQDTNWIHMSVFYNKENWHFLLREFIKPVTVSLLERLEITKFIIQMGHNRGDHINLSLECKSDLAERLIAEVHSLLAEFLVHHPSSTVIRKFPIKNFFKDFENNSIQYNLFQFSGLEFDDVDQFIIDECQYFLSKLILDVFSREKYDEESLLPFLMYVHLCFFYAWEHTPIGSTLLSQFAIQPVSTLDLTLEEVFNKNKTNLKEIVRRIWASEPYDDCSDLRWLTIWKQGCTDIAKKMAVQTSNAAVKNTLNMYKMLFTRINSQSGISNSGENLIFQLLKKTYEDVLSFPR